MSKKLAITGDAGFIGSNLAEALAADNEVVAIDDLSSGKLQNMDGIDAKIIRGCVTDLSLLERAFQDVDCMFHLAAIASVQRSVEDPVKTNKGIKELFRRKTLNIQNPTSNGFVCDSKS